MHALRHALAGTVCTHDAIYLQTHKKHTDKKKKKYVRFSGALLFVVLRVTPSISHRFFASGGACCARMGSAFIRVISYLRILNMAETCMRVFLYVSCCVIDRVDAQHDEFWSAASNVELYAHTVLPFYFGTYDVYWETKTTNRIFIFLASILSYFEVQ